MESLTATSCCHLPDCQYFHSEGFSCLIKYPKSMAVRFSLYHSSKSPDRILLLIMPNKAMHINIPVMMAELYKNRCSVELFKWLKQHLHVKEFYGTSENADNIQIYSAIITYCVVAIVCSELRLKMSTQELLRIVGVFYLTKHHCEKC